MITFERSTDWETIKKIVTHPKVYPSVTDDDDPPADQWEPARHDRALYVLVKDGPELLGLWAFSRHNMACWEVHTCLLPNSWGHKSRDAVKQLASWVWANMPAQRIITEVPEYNRIALRFALEAGLTQYGLNPKAFPKNGKLHDVILLGITRPGVN